MDPTGAAHALARASATLTDGHDVSGTLAALLRGCKDTLEVDAAGILLGAGAHLELISASSHAASELETHQAQIDEGPCIDAYASGTAITASGKDELLERWPTFGTTMLQAGFSSVHASPLRWRGATLGAMGLFRRSDDAFTGEDDTFAQAFADIATILILSTDELAVEELSDRLQRALNTRIVIEQAKGVLAEQYDLDMAEAYDLLLQSSTGRKEPLAEWAAQIVKEAGPAPRP